MLSGSTVKIVSARKIFLAAGVVFIAMAMVVVGFWVYLATLVAQQPDKRPSSAPVYQMAISSSAGVVRTYTLTGAETAADQARGLGDADALPTDHGMVFVYKSDQQRCFWMKNMRFPIDMIWLDHTKIVTHIEPNVSPSTYPQQFCNIGTYVVELNAGEAAHSGLTVGQAVTF